MTGTIIVSQRDENNFKFVFQSDKKTAFITFEGKRTEEGCHFSHTESFGMTTPIIGPIMNFIIFKIIYKKKANWQLIRDDMILDNKYLYDILTEGKYPERILKNRRLCMKKEKFRQSKLSEQIVRHCSPTLAGLKSGNMFSAPCENFQDVLCEIRILNQRLTVKGIKIIPLRYSGKRCLIYVFRPAALKCDLADEQACKVLKDFGYENCKPGKCIGRLLKRLNSPGQFPHEIGLFLGYPPEDVCGFIRNKGKCPKRTGHWQVYGDEEFALAKFESFNRCTRIFCKMAALGFPIEELAVAG